MLFKVQNGSMKDIVPGSQVMVVTGYLPPEFDQQLIPIVEVRDGYPFAQLEEDQLSAIDPQIIKVVIAP